MKENGENSKGWTGNEQPSEDVLSSAIQASSQIIIELSDLVDISIDEKEIGVDMDAVHTRGIITLKLRY